MRSFLVHCKSLKMRGGKMTDLSRYKIFSDHLSTLKETSVDDRDGEKIYMTESLRRVINFDDVKNEYVKRLGLSEIPKSNDALFEDGKGSLLFVEFKNGFMDRSKQFAVRKKVYDSVLIFTDITSSRISDMRNTVKYILVYNEFVNRENSCDEELRKKQKTTIQPSPSFDGLARTLGKYANEEYVCFGLKIFLNYCFKEVHTYTEEEFETYLSSL